MIGGVDRAAVIGSAGFGIPGFGLGLGFGVQTRGGNGNQIGDGGYVWLMKLLGEDGRGRRRDEGGADDVGLLGHVFADERGGDGQDLWSADVGVNIQRCTGTVGDRDRDRERDWDGDGVRWDGMVRFGLLGLVGGVVVWGSGFYRLSFVTYGGRRGRDELVLGGIFGLSAG